MKFIDLFCGAGLVSEGAKSAGLEPIAGADMEQVAMESYLANHPECEKIVFDLLRPGGVATALEVAGADRSFNGVIWMSPPCQKVSNASRGRPSSDVSALYECIAEAAEYAPLALIVVENVSGFVEAKYEQHRIDMAKRIYKARRVLVDDEFLKRFVINALECGVPQSRTRLVFPIAPRSGRYQTPYKGMPDAGLLTLRASIGTNFVDVDPVSWPMLPNEHEIFSEIPPGGNWRDSTAGRKLAQETYKGKSVPDWFLKRPNWDETPACVMASKLVWLKSGNFVHPQELRRFTLGEYRAFQTIPGKYVIKGIFKERVRQIGNAVPPRMVSTLLSHFVQNLS